MKIFHKITIMITIVAFIWSCETPESLKPISGIEGNFFIEGEWPDSIQAVALIVLNSLDPNNLAAGLVTYSTPITPPINEAEYFFQLEPGYYFIVGAGLTIDPVLFFANFDSIVASGSLPIIQLDKTPSFLKIVDLGEQQVIEIDHTIQFDN